MEVSYFYLLGLIGPLTQLKDSSRNPLPIYTPFDRHYMVAYSK